MTGAISVQKDVKIKYIREVLHASNLPDCTARRKNVRLTSENSARHFHSRFLNYFVIWHALRQIKKFLRARAWKNAL